MFAKYNKNCDFSMCKRNSPKNWNGNTDQRLNSMNYKTPSNPEFYAPLRIISTSCDSFLYSSGSHIWKLAST